MANYRTIVAALSVNADGIQRNITGTVSLWRNSVAVFLDQPMEVDTQGFFRYRISPDILSQKGMYQYAFKFKDSLSGDVAFEHGEFTV